MRVRLSTALFVTALALALPASSLAGPPRGVPPGNSGATQYTETLPGPGGSEPTGDIRDQAGASPQKALGTKNASGLQSLGPAGRAAAQLAAETAPPAADKTSTSKPRGAPSPDSAGSSGLSRVLEEVSGSSGSGGMGILLPLLIFLGLVGAIAFAFSRRRTTQD